MADVFLEQLVKKQNTPLDYIKKSLILFAGLLLAFVAFQFSFVRVIGSVAFLIAVGALYFAWYFITGMNLEFEYIYTNGEIDVDKISAKRKRKRMVTVRVSSFEEFGKLNLETYRRQKYDITYNAAESLRAENCFYAVFHSREGKKCVLLFNPNERLLEAIESQHRRAHRAGQV